MHAIFYLLLFLISSLTAVDHLLATPGNAATPTGKKHVSQWSLQEWLEQTFGDAVRSGVEEGSFYPPAYFHRPAEFIAAGAGGDFRAGDGGVSVR